MNRTLNWGGGGGNRYPATSNSEYGRMAFLAAGNSAGNPANNYGGDPAGITITAPTMSSADGSPLISFTPGHAHQPNCPNYGAGNGQSYGGAQYPNTGRGGVYGTGGNSSTDFQVLTGDAAAAVLGRSNHEHGAQYQYNYSIPEQANVSQGNQNQDGGDGEGSAPSANVNGFQIQGSNMPSGDYAAMQQGPGFSGQKPGGMVPATGLRSAKPPRYMQANPTMPHVYSSVRMAQKSGDAVPNFSLCGKCAKCKRLQDPVTLTPSNLNFQQQGRTSAGSLRFALPKAVSSGAMLKPTASVTSVPKKGSRSRPVLRAGSKLAVGQTASLPKM